MSLKRRLMATLPPPVKSALREIWSSARADSLGTARKKARAYMASRLGRPVCVNLGCGLKPFEGWLNVDAIRLGNVISYDLRKGLPMLDDGAVDLIYHEHFLEHLDRRSARRLVQECRRVLRTGGTMRIAMPDLDLCIAKYLEGWADEDNTFVETRKELYGDQLLGTPGEGLDLRLRGWSHQFVYGERDVTRMLQLNGFDRVRRVAYRVSEIPELSGLETRGPEQSALIVEAHT